MSLSLPRKKIKIAIIIIVSAQVKTDLNATPPIEGTVYETISEQMARAQVLLFDVAESTWGVAAQEAWDAVEAIHNELKGSASEATLQTLSATLQNKLDALG